MMTNRIIRVSGLNTPPEVQSAEVHATPHATPNVSRKRRRDACVISSPADNTTFPAHLMATPQQEPREPPPKVPRKGRRSIEERPGAGHTIEPKDANMENEANQSLPFNIDTSTASGIIVYYSSIVIYIM